MQYLIVGEGLFGQQPQPAPLHQISKQQLGAAHEFLGEGSWTCALHT